MAESVRELVVTLSMSAGTFSKTCTDINTQIKGVQAEFNAITGGVDDWQTTMEGREAKLKALNETLGLQQTKITTIAEELEKANLALAADPGNLKAAKKVSSLETQLNNAKTAANLTKLEIEKLNAIKLTNAANALNSFGSTLKSFGRKFSMYVGGPLAALGVTSFNAFKDYEMSAALLEGKLDAPKEEVDALVDAALAMSEEIPVSFEEIMALMTGLAAAGVPVENIEKMALVMSRLSAVTGMSAEDVSTNMVMFMNSMGLPLDNVDQLASALVSLADKSIATEADIFAMATKMAATGALAGLSATDVLSLSAAFASMGIDAEAGGTAASKLMKKMQLAAETGNGLEGFANAMGISTEQFIAGWDANPAQQMLGFFQGLSDMDTSGQESVLAMLDTMGLTEVRLSNLIAVGASNPDLFAGLMGTGAAGFEENSALVEKAGLLFETVSGQMDMIQNSMKNTQADLGENVADVFSPIIEKVGELVTSFGELDEDTQTRWVNVGAALVAVGPVAGLLGVASKGVGGIVKALAEIKIGDVNNMGLLAKLLSSPATWGVAAGGALLLASSYISDIIHDTDEITEKLGSVPISIDKTSVDKSLEQIALVQAAADKLSGAELKEEYASTSAAVKAGYGTSDTFGKAVAYEKALAEKAMTDAAGEYAPLINDYNAQIAAANADGNDVMAAALFADLKDTQADWDRAANDAKASYTTAISDLYNGMLKSRPEIVAEQAKGAETYDLYAAILDAMALGDNFGDEHTAAWKNVFTNNLAQALVPNAAYWQETDMSQWGILGQNIKDQAMRALAESFNTVNEGTQAFSLINTLLNAPGAMDLLDVTGLQGAMDGAFKLLDYKGAVAAGKDITQGLADGTVENAAVMTPTMETIRDKTLEAIRAAFEMHSPSLLMAREGFNIPAGVAQGIMLGIPMAAAAMNTLGAALTAIASSQGASAGAAYGAAFSKQASVQLSLAINDLKRQLSLLEIRINRGYGSTS